MTNQLGYREKNKVILFNERKNGFVIFVDPLTKDIISIA